MPISAYGRRKLPNNPGSLEDLTERLEEKSVTADMNEENVEREESIALVANKDDVILIAKFKGMSGPFILGKLAQNLKRTSSTVKTHLYASDPEGCLIFNYVEKHLVIGTVWKVQFTDEDFQIDLNQELYEECLERTGGLKKGT